MSNVEIVAPVVGDIGSCVSALSLRAWAPNGRVRRPNDNAVKTKRDENVAKMAPLLMNNNSPMDYHGALGALRNVIKELDETILINEGRRIHVARGVIDITGRASG